MVDNLSINIKIRPASLDDADSISDLQNQHAKEMKILEMPKSSEKIRLAIGSSFLNKNSYYVVEQNDEIIGFIEQLKQNHSHVMISYPYMDLRMDPLVRRETQLYLIETTLKKLKKYGYQYVSTQVSQFMEEARDLFYEHDFTQEQTIFQTYYGHIHPDGSIGTEGIEFRRVKIKDLDRVYRWIKRQLNPLSPIYITREYFERLLHAPKEVRDGWSMAVDEESGKPIAMVSSMIDAHSGDVIVFGPFNEEEHDEVRLKLLNELLWYHSMHGRENMRLLRIELFDNDEELLSIFGLEKQEELTILTKQLY